MLKSRCCDATVTTEITGYDMWIKLDIQNQICVSTFCDTCYEECKVYEDCPALYSEEEDTDYPEEDYKIYENENDDDNYDADEHDRYADYYDDLKKYYPEEACI